MLQAVTPGTGTVALMIKHTAPPSLDEGPQTLTFSESQTERAVSFTAKAGQSVRLSLHLTSGSNGSPNITVMQGDQTIASASGSTVSDLIVGFTPTDNGQVVVQVTESSYTNLSYQVTLSQSNQ